ncbi:MAG TPA: PilZ domain-containing protein [Planctomycetota bacterium]|nr:PilZ domain-containing protein [Planctomycetota bacterium]
MGVSQQAIADALGLSRTTVTKILNRDPKYSASESTRDLVFSTAEKMGYDFTTIRRPFKREYGRTEVNTRAIIEILSEGDNAVWDKGEAIARNVGVGGALLTSLKLPKNSLPLSKFSIKCRFLDIPQLADLTGECQVVRITDSSEGHPELGVRFINASVSDRKAIKDFVDAQAAEQQAARAAAMSKAAAPTPAQKA